MEVPMVGAGKSIEDLSKAVEIHETKLITLQTAVKTIITAKLWLHKKNEKSETSFKYPLSKSLETSEVGWRQFSEHAYLVEDLRFTDAHFSFASEDIVFVWQIERLPPVKRLSGDAKWSLCLGLSILEILAAGQPSRGLLLMFVFSYDRD